MSDSVSYEMQIKMGGRWEYFDTKNTAEELTCMTTYKRFRAKTGIQARILRVETSKTVVDSTELNNEQGE